MFTRMICSLALCALSSAAVAQTTSSSMSESASQSGSYNSLTLEGSDVPNNTPGLGGLVGSAGNCYPGASAQVVGPGFGVGFGGGRVDPECNTRMEMAALKALAGNRAAILHACREDDSMRGTLVQMGLCTSASPQSRPVASSRSSAPVAKAYTSCAMQNGQLRVGVKPGASDAQRRAAVRQCRSDI